MSTTLKYDVIITIDSSIINGYVIIERKNNYSTLSIYNDKNNKILYEYIFNNMAIELYDTTFECKINNIMIKFDNNSASAWTNFKTELCIIVNTKNEIIKYDSGNPMCIGDITKYDDNSKKLNGNGTLFYDYPNKIKYIGDFVEGLMEGSGTFHSFDGYITISVNNIVSSIPKLQGELIINYPNYKQTIDLNFTKIWFKLDLFGKNKEIQHLVKSDNFVNTIAKLMWNNEKTLEEYEFSVMTNDQKCNYLYTKVLELSKHVIVHNNNQTELINYKYNKQLNLIFIFGMMLMMFNCWIYYVQYKYKY